MEQRFLLEAVSPDKAVKAWKGLLCVDNFNIVHSMRLYYTVFHLDVWPKDYPG
jgi:hypothetical protein